MIRGLVLILGLWLGLCLAALFGGTIGHLRQVAGWTGWTLPVWTEGVEDGSGLARGVARIEGAGLGGARLTWTLAGWSGFALTLGGPDWQALGFARPSGRVLEVGDLSGIVPLDGLVAGSAVGSGAGSAVGSASSSGAMALQGGALVIGLDGTLRAARIEGQARGGAVEGPVRLIWDGGWALDANP